MINESYKRFSNILKQYGRAVTFEKNDVLYDTQAYIEPLTHENRQYLDEKYSNIGYLDQNVFRYIGSAEGDGALLSAGDILHDGNALFSVSTTEKLKVGTKTFFIWALLRRAEEDTTQ